MILYCFFHTYRINLVNYFKFTRSPHSREIGRCFSSMAKRFTTEIW